MNILVTGGCGFLGSNIAAGFLNRGDEVVVIDALFRTGGEANLEWLKSQGVSSQLTFYRHDLADRDAVEEVFARHRSLAYVCHLGGQVAMTTSLNDPHRDMRTNVAGTLNVLEACRKFSPDALVAFSSTNKVYGDLERFEYFEGPTRYTVPAAPRGFDENLPLDFASPYGCSKGAADQYVRDWFRNFGLRTVVFRHSSIYGGRQFATFDQGWIGWFCAQTLEQGRVRAAGDSVVPFTIAGNGKQVRDVLHAEDLVALYQGALHQPDSVAGEIFNIGGGIENSLSLLELFDRLRTETGHSPEFTETPARRSDQKFFVANIAKAGWVLGWAPQVSVAAGLTRMLEWLQEHHAAA